MTRCARVAFQAPSELAVSGKKHGHSSADVKGGRRIGGLLIIPKHSWATCEWKGANN